MVLIFLVSIRSKIFSLTLDNIQDRQALIDFPFLAMHICVLSSQSFSKHDMPVYKYIGSVDNQWG